MFTVERLRQYPGLVKAFTGTPAEAFWALAAAAAVQRPEQQREQRERPNRQRAAGGAARGTRRSARQRY